MQPTSKAEGRVSFVSETSLCSAFNGLNLDDAANVFVVYMVGNFGVKPRFAGDCASGHRRSSGASPEQKSDITDSFSPMILRLHDVYDPNKWSSGCGGQENSSCLGCTLHNTLQAPVLSSLISKTRIVQDQPITPTSSSSSNCSVNCVFLFWNKKL
ncbi:hypothetical protein Vadar_014480 [Vaccinium darrowii]|uniref:Uncharacterized protein n=1 Tax=Vaccinium darrowii TaxID=229202 RepID=A0ACB7YLN0_9ERIC|nr:hypothetical protein Vadar_014480 [Vaccinium darrowii]